MSDRGRSSASDVHRLLSQLCDLAAETVDGADAAAVTLVHDGVPHLQSSTDFARAVDRIQYRTGEGPCIDAATHACTVVSGSLGTGEPRWPQFVAATRTLAVMSVLSLPLVAEGCVIGSINLYSRRSDAFDERSIAAAEAFARPAALSVSAACAPARASDADAGDVLPPDLVRGIEAVVGEVMDPQLRSAALSRMVEEIYQTLAWALGGQPGQAELASFAQVLAAAYAHEDRVVALQANEGRR